MLQLTCIYGKLTVLFRERAAKPERPGKRQKADLTKAREDMLAKVKDEMDQY